MNKSMEQLLGTNYLSPKICAVKMNGNGETFFNKALVRALRREVLRVCGNSAIVITCGKDNFPCYPFISFYSRKAILKFKNSVSWKRLAKSVTASGLGSCTVRYI